MPQFDRHLDLAFPCGGIDAPGFFLKDFKCKYNVRYFYDIAEYTAPVLQQLRKHLSPDIFHLGSVSGNLLEADVTSWSRCDGLISGPPCPPWSMIGQRGHMDDIRAQVYEKITLAIIDQGHKGCLFWVVEMVDGIRCKTNGKQISFYEDWLRRLREKAPMWRIDSLALNASDWHLPQNRPRTYTVGTHRVLLPVAPLPPLPVRTPSFVSDILHQGLPPFREENLTTKQKLNLLMVKQTLKNKGLIKPGALITLSLDRDPRKEFGYAARADGVLSTLRTGNEMQWILRWDLAGALIMSRPIHPLERLAAQGLPSWLGDCLSKRELMIATGHVATLMFLNTGACIYTHSCIYS